MNERTCSVRISLSCTSAPSTGLSSGSVTCPCRLRELASSFFSFLVCAAEETANAAASARLNRIRERRLIVCLLHSTRTTKRGRRRALYSLLRFRNQQKGCIYLLFSRNVKFLTRFFKSF